MKYLFLFCAFLIAQPNGFSQEYYRFSAEFSIKEKEKGAEQGSLVMGTVLYDTEKKATRYDVQFPERELWLMLDTLMYRIVGDSIVEKDTVQAFGEYSFFYVILHQQLNDFGLKKVGYSPSEVWEEKGKTFAKWTPPAELKSMLNPVVLMQEKKLLTGITFLDATETPVGRFYFQDYDIVKGLPVPKKVFQVFTKADGSQNMRMMTFKSIKINEETDPSGDPFRLPRS